MDKKGFEPISTVAILLVLFIFVFFLVNIAQRECHDNNDCAENAYCGTDYECHQYPDNIITTKSNFIPASIILGISLVGAAYVYRGGKIPFLEKKGK